MPDLLPGARNVGTVGMGRCEPRYPSGMAAPGLQGFLGWLSGRYGQLSGMVEPLAGVFGAFAVVLAEPLLPYALGFAAGAMVYVVMDDIIPEAQTRWDPGNGPSPARLGRERRFPLPDRKSVV